MGRHNTIAGRMATSAASRGRLFTKLTRELMVAARFGSDPSTNAALRAAVAKAKDNSMPKENIERAIKKGAGEAGNSTTTFEEILYEGFSPGGAAVLVEVLTDNRNRTYPEVRRLFQKYGGNLGEMGVVGWMFKKCGVFFIDSTKFTEDKIMEVALEAGADDVERNAETTSVICDAADFSSVREAFLNANIDFTKAGLEYLSENELDLTPEAREQTIELLEKLEEHDDVQKVYTNASL